MGYQIATLEKNGGDDCHYQFLAAIKTFAESNGWTTLRYNTVSANREWIGKSLGLSGEEEIFIGFRTYQNVTSDYYNILAAVFTGYAPENSFDTQPGIITSGIPAHNNAIKYYMVANPQRIAFVLKVGTPVFTHGYAGKMFQYARPGEFRSPLVCCGMLIGAAATRYSDTAMVMGYKGSRNNFRLRDNMGAWLAPSVFPWNTSYLTGGSANIQPTGDNYFPLHLELMSSGNIFGRLDGIYHISGFNNAVENVLQIGGSSIVDQSGLTPEAAVSAILAVGGRAFVVAQDAYRTGFNDYICMEMA